MSFMVIAGVDYGRDLNATVVGTTNFTYGEFVESSTALRYNIKNIPTEEEWKAIEHIAVTICQPLRDKLGELQVDSGFRCPELNEKVGSSDTSFHAYACAVDLKPKAPGVTLVDLLKAACELPYNEVIAEYFPTGWVHVGCQAGRSDQVIKLKDNDHNYTHMSLDDILAIYHN